MLNFTELLNSLNIFEAFKYDVSTFLVVIDPLSPCQQMLENYKPLSCQHWSKNSSQFSKKSSNKTTMVVNGFQKEG